MIKTALQWLFVIGGCAVSSYYLNWVAYQPAASQDGSLRSVLRLALQWYGIPTAMVVQMLIWWFMPTLFRITPSPWLAAMVWPLISAICKVIILWQIKRPGSADWVTIVGFSATTVLSWYLKGKQ